MYVKIENPYFIVDMMYAHKTNMVQRAPYLEIGWGNLAVVHKDLWLCLKKLLPFLKEKELKLKIHDAYRPPKAHDIMKSLIPMDGFFAHDAEKSQHCHATAVDVCLCNESGEELLYPTPVDAYDPQLAKEVLSGNDKNFKQYLQKARHDSFAGIPEEAIANRENLRQLMEGVGLDSLDFEWWHYTLPNGNSKEYPLVELNREDFV